MSSTATSLGNALLGLLHQSQQTGYALQKFFEDSPMGIYSSSPGAIYPALKRLEQKGLVTSSLVDTGPVQRARVYGPTPEGTAALLEWLVQPITRRDIEAGMDKLMLRFAFLGLIDSEGATRAFLEDLVRQLDAYLDVLAAIRSELVEKGVGRHGRLALEGGIETYRAHARWARGALAEFTHADVMPAAAPGEAHAHG